MAFTNMLSILCQDKPTRKLGRTKKESRFFSGRTKCPVGRGMGRTKSEMGRTMSDVRPLFQALHCAVVIVTLQIQRGKTLFMAFKNVILFLLMKSTDYYSRATHVTSMH